MLSEFTSFSLFRIFPNDVKCSSATLYKQARLGYVAVTNGLYIPVAPRSGHLVLTRAKYDVSPGSLFSAQ